MTLTIAQETINALIILGWLAGYMLVVIRIAKKNEPAMLPVVIAVLSAALWPLVLVIWFCTAAARVMSPESDRSL